jgi:hypothetical protein
VQAYSISQWVQFWVLRPLVVRRKKWQEQIMAEHKQPHQQAALQLHQGASVLQPQYQAAVLAVQDLEHQRLRLQHSAVNPPDQLKTSQHYKGKI